MLLTQLHPKFLIFDGSPSYRETNYIHQASGLWFLCPRCFHKNNGPEGTHSIICWNPSVPADISPLGGRWIMTGYGYDDLSLNPSIQLIGDSCKAHFTIQKGIIDHA